MAQDKRVFTGGMDKDSDPRLIKDGDYRHAENIRNIASSDSTSGSVENIEGSKKVNYNFPGEDTNIITFNDESGFINDVEPAATLYSQKIILIGRELAGKKFDFTIVNHIDNNGTLATEGISLSWDGNAEGTKTTEYLYGKFGPSGSLSENITIINKNTGDLSTAHVNQETLNFTSGVPSMSSGGLILEIEIIADNPGIDFELNFVSSHSAEANQLWSSTIDNMHPNGHLFIQNNGDMILSSAYDFGISEVINDSTSDDGSPIGDFPGSLNGVTQVLLEFEGVEPEIPEDTSGITIFSYNENANGTFTVIPFVEIGSDSFDSGDDYEFDDSQNNIAEALVDKFTDFSSPVLETSIGQQIILKTRSNIITGFNKSTRLNGNLSSKSTDNGTASSDYYFLLNNYVSVHDLLPLTIPLEATLASNVYTIEGKTIHAGDNFFFPANIINGKSYRVQGTLTTMVGGNSIKFKGGKEESTPFSIGGSSIEYTFTAKDNLDKFSFEVENNFATGTDAIAITGLTISEFQEPNNKLQVLIQGSSRYDFNLCFGVSEEQVATNLRDGLLPETQTSFIDGKVSARIIPYTSTGSGYDDTTNPLVLLEFIQTLTLEIESLEAQIVNLNLNHTDALSVLNAQLDANSAQAQADLNALQAELGVLNTTYDALFTNYNQVNTELIEALDAADISAETIADLNSQITALGLQVETLQAAVANAVGSNLITNGGFDNETLDGTQGWYTHPNASSGSVSISGGVLNLNRPKVPVTGDVTAVFAFNSDASSAITENGKFYRLSFDIFNVEDFTGTQTTVEMKYHSGSTEVSLGTEFTTGSSVIKYYEATGGSLIIANHTGGVNVSIDNVVLEEISSATINDFIDLETQLENAETATADAENALDIANSNLATADVNWATAYNNILSTLTTLLGTASSTVSNLEGVTLTNSDLEDSISAITTELNNIISDTATLADSIGVSYSQELTISQNVSSLNSEVTTLTGLIDGMINDLPDYSTQSSSSLNTAVALYKTAAQAALTAANDALTSAITLNDTLTDEVDAANAAAQAANAATAEANNALDAVEAQLDAALIHDDGVTQADVDAVQAELDAVVHEDGITQATVDAAVAAIDVEDGVSQADVEAAVALIQLDVNAVQALLDAANAALVAANAENVTHEAIIETNNDLISSLEGQIENLNGSIDDLNSILTLGEDVILNGDFSNGAVFWSNTQAWSIISGQLCRAVNASNSYHPMQGSLTLPPGSYILSMDIGRHPTDDVFQGSLSPRIRNNTNTTDEIDVGNINSVGNNQVFTFTIPDNGVTYEMLWLTQDDFVGSIDNISLQSYSAVGGGAVSEEDYEDLVLANETLETDYSDLLNAQDTLNSHVIYLSAANTELTADVALLWNYMDSLITSVAETTNITGPVLGDLSATANITQEEIDDFVLGFNITINTLNSAIATLTENLDNATAGVESTFSLESSDQNDRYRFTFVGNIPAIENTEDAGIFFDAYKDNYNWGYSKLNANICGITSEFPTQYTYNGYSVSGTDKPGIFAHTSGTNAHIFKSSSVGMGGGWRDLFIDSSPSSYSVSPAFAHNREMDMVYYNANGFHTFVYRYNTTMGDWEAYKITYLTGNGLMVSNVSEGDNANNIVNHSSNQVGEAGPALDQANISDWLGTQSFTNGTTTKNGITNGVQIEVEVLYGTLSGLYFDHAQESKIGHNAPDGPVLGAVNPNFKYTLADFPEVEGCGLTSSAIRNNHAYPLANNGTSLRAFRLDCFAEFFAGSTPDVGNEVRNGDSIYTGSARRMFKSFYTGDTTTTSIDTTAFNWKCVGTYEDKPKGRVYYFVSSDSVDGKKHDSILEYDLLRNSIVTVYQDGRPSTSGNPNNILNLRQGFLITGVDKVDDILYWTDNLNRPKKINVELAKANEVNISNATSFQDVYYNGDQSSVFIGVSDNHGFEIGDHIYTQINQSNAFPGTEGNNGYTKVTGVIPKLVDPVTGYSGITLKVTNGNPSITVYNSDGNVTNNFGTLSEGDFIGIEEMVDGVTTNFPYYYEVESVSGSTITLTTPYNQTTTSSAPFANPLQNQSDFNVGGLITECPWAGSFSALPGKILHINPQGAYSPLVSFGDTIEKAKYLDVIKHQPTHKPITELSIDNSIAANNILDNVFQFKYRYLHTDEEATSYSPISDVFIDPAFALNSVVSANNYLDIANKISLTYDDATPDVDTIEIVARKGNDGEFFLVDTLQNNFIKYLKKLKNEVIAGSEYDYTNLDSVLPFYNNGTYPYIDRADSNKLYDAVPKKAKAQTILSNNRIAYGNIVEGYDNTKMIINSKFTNTGAVTLTSENISIPLVSTDIDDMLGDNSSTSSPLGGAGFGTDGDYTEHNPVFNLSGLNLAEGINQVISIDYAWTLFHNPTFGATIHRNGSYSTGPIDITDFTTIESLGLYLQTYINNDGGTVGDFSGTGFFSLNATYNSGQLEIEFTFNENSGNGYSSFELASNAFNFTNHSSLIQGDGGLSSFKTGAFHNFGVAYFDETNRCSFVNAAPDYGVSLGGTNLNGTRPYNKFYTENAGWDLSTSSSVNFSIYNKPPAWATHYQMYYTGNTTVDEFIQMTVVNAKVSLDADDKQIYLSLQSLKGEGWSYNESNNSQIGYNFVKGDRVRFISFDPGPGRYKFTEYVDLEIAGDDLYTGEDGEPFPASSEPISGFYIRINDPENTSVGTGFGNVNLAHSGLSSSIDGTGYENLIVEIYRPKKDLDEDLMVYYEVGKKYPILQAGEYNRSHSGDGNQTSDYTFNKELNVDVSGTPSSINITSGDIYLKPRVMATSNTGGSFTTFFPEDYYLNDFHRTNHYSKGRINVINNNAAERHLEASVYYSETYSSTGSINGLSNFDLANSPYYDYNKNFGSIQSLMMRDDDLLIFHENKVGRVLVQKDILTTASGEGLVSLSNKIISNYVSLYSGEYGCCLQPESIVKFGNKFYFVDIKRGTVLRLSNDGLTVISDQGMRDYFRDLGEMYVINDPEKSKENVFNLVGGYDPKYDEYIVTFPDVYEGGSGAWEGERVSWDSNYGIYKNKTVRDKIFDSKTIAFNERVNRWTSFYDFYPEYYGRVGRQFIGFKDGELYKHNMTDRGYQNLHTGPGADWRGKYNHLYGTQYDSMIQFPFNAEPSSVKSYNAISLESDSKFFTSMYTNTGQTVSGGSYLSMGYDTTTDTEIGYRKVEGLINNYSSETGSETLIKGVGTKFFEDVKRGDTVRVWGTSTSGGYTYATRVVAYVVSNEILRLSNWAGLTLEDSYMEVIDYKTKEGVQYAQIPFVKSSTDGDITAATTEDHGDGSEFEGVGVLSYSSSSDTWATFTGSNVNSMAKINKIRRPKDMIVGAEYVVRNTTNADILDDEFSIVSEADPSYGETLVGSVFTCKHPSTGGIGYVLTTEYKLYLQKEDGSTVFMGYPYYVSTTGIDFVEDDGFYSSDSYTDNVFLFIVKNGNVEGEKMKGQYMMTTLTTGYSGSVYTSRYKFNLYAANADIDKSELSNR